MNLTFTGGKELARALRQLPADVSEKWLERAVVWGGNIVRDSARAKAPRPAERRRPGTVPLAASIKVSVTEKGRSFVTANVGTNVKYAHPVEYGHQIVPRGPNRRRVSVTRVSKSGRTTTRFMVDPDEKRTIREGARGFVAPRPFLRPAFDENREAMINRIGDVLRKGIEIEGQKYARQMRAA